MNDDKKTVVLCPGEEGCCPQLTFGKDGVVITDDFGGKVKLTTEQFDLLKGKIISKEL